MKEMQEYIWDGSANTGNELFGERFGVDWSYVGRDSSDIWYQDENGVRHTVRVGQKVRRMPQMIAQCTKES